MSNKPKVKTNITKITANSAPKSEDKPETTSAHTAKPTKTIVKSTSKPNQQVASKSKHKSVEEKPLREVFLLARPFVALGRYLRDSWREIRQVRWPNRKATWKMTLAVFIYCAIFMIFILVLDALFTFIFDLLLGVN